jgi:hypothetical protein
MSAPARDALRISSKSCAAALRIEFTRSLSIYLTDTHQATLLLISFPYWSILLINEGNPKGKRISCVALSKALL